MLLHNICKFNTYCVRVKWQQSFFTFLQAFSISEDCRVRLHGLLHSQS